MAFNIVPPGELNEFGLTHGTGKASRNHDYLRLYEFFLSPLRNEEFTLLELGVGGPARPGASLFMWLDYFPKAKVIGVDIKPESKQVERDRLSVIIGDLNKRPFVQQLATSVKPAVIVDDAAHDWASQIGAFEVLFWSLEPGGLYFVEDMQNSFGERREKHEQEQYQDAAAYFLALALLANGDRTKHPLLDELRPSGTLLSIATEVDFVVALRNAYVIVKQSETDARRIQRAAKDRDATEERVKSDADRLARRADRLARRER